VIGRRDGAALSLGLLAVAAFHLPLALGRTYFWGDLTYLHFPWKTLAAQQVLGGRFPHWNPYAYMGMPLHGNFQSAVLYPGSVPFWTFPFEAGLAFFLVGHAALGLVFAYLWLRRVGARPAGAILASLGLVLGGVWVAHMPFLNHLGAIAWMPAMMLLPMPWAFGAALGMSLLDGYPTMTAGAWAAAMVLRPLWEGFRWGGSLGGLVVGLGLASPLLGPALRLAADSQRALGLPLSVVTEYSFHFRDWLQFLEETGRPEPKGDWVHYVKGPVLYWQHIFKERELKGMDVLVASNLLAGVGLASSSALVAASGWVWFWGSVLLDERRIEQTYGRQWRPWNQDQAQWDWVVLLGWGMLVLWYFLRPSVREKFRSETR